MNAVSPYLFSLRLFQFDSCQLDVRSPRHVNITDYPHHRGYNPVKLGSNRGGVIDPDLHLDTGDEDGGAPGDYRPGVSRATLLVKARPVVDNLGVNRIIPLVPAPVIPGDKAMVSELNELHTSDC